MIKNDKTGGYNHQKKVRDVFRTKERQKCKNRPKKGGERGSLGPQKRRIIYRKICSKRARWDTGRILLAIRSDKTLTVPNNIGRLRFLNDRLIFAPIVRFPLGNPKASAVLEGLLWLAFLKGYASVRKKRTFSSLRGLHLCRSLASFARFSHRQIIKMESLVKQPEL